MLRFSLTVGVGTAPVPGGEAMVCLLVQQDRELQEYQARHEAWGTQPGPWLGSSLGVGLGGQTGGKAKSNS